MSRAIQQIVFRMTVVGGAIFFGASCTPTGYFPPEPPVAWDRSVVLDKPFDEAWADIVRHVSSGPKKIEGTENAPGRLLIAIEAVEASRYIDCGRFAFETERGLVEGPYAELLQHGSGANLRGTLDVLLRPRGDRQSNLTVNAEFVFSLPAKGGQVSESSGLPATVWSFDSATWADRSLLGSYADEDSIRTCRSTGVLEGNFIEAVRDSV